TPLVVDGVIFTTEPPDDVLALDVRTGRKLWSYQHRLPSKLPLCCGRVNRGLAMTGSTLYLGTLDAHLVAVDAGSGDVKWDVEVADPAQGYSITGAPLAFGQMVVIGVSGGEFGARGLLAAYDTRNGRKLWQFDTVPSPGSPGSETWKSDAWRNGGGPTWMTGSYDPSAHLLYWGVGNPSPVYVGDLRPGDNLFTDSVLALQPETGKLVWHFQFSPHDEHDWDSNQTPVLADLPVKGTPRKLMLWANRNGFYYVLDRVTGEFLGATPFVRQNWAERIDARGRPVLSAAGRVSERGSLTYPGIGGGTNWQAVAFDPRLNYFLVQATEGSSVYTKSAPDLVRHVTGELYVGSGNESVSPVTAVVRALDAVSGEKVWEYLSPETRHLGSSGLLATEGGLVFGCSGGEMFAVDSHTGREGWRMFLGGRTVAAPISVDIDGRQTILVAAGRALFALGL
ncbi:MAG TPA: PQQ-binding-like beta-propeller repeat protein, partial [Steroidobacteraceae bacterium]|nr:PQQ-binding-like beta-propeller repeat protein [Steroidobacteraceae bacterium]